MIIPNDRNHHHHTHQLTSWVCASATSCAGVRSAHPPCISNTRPPHVASPHSSLTPKASSTCLRSRLKRASAAKYSRRSALVSSSTTATTCGGKPAILLVSFALIIARCWVHGGAASSVTDNCSSVSNSSIHFSRDSRCASAPRAQYGAKPRAGTTSCPVTRSRSGRVGGGGRVRGGGRATQAGTHRARTLYK